jgi:hypothetical protein
VRHLLVLAGENSGMSWEQRREKAQELCDLWQNGGGTEMYLAELAEQFSDDNSSRSNGGLFTDLTTEEELDETFKAWFSDSNRTAGDSDLIKSQHGYHIVYFCDSVDQWRYASRQRIQNQISSELLEQSQTLHPAQIQYDQIHIAQVSLGDT